MSMKNSDHTIGNRNRDLPVYSAVPQPTEPPRAPPYVNTGATDVCETPTNLEQSPHNMCQKTAIIGLKEDGMLYTTLIT
jgi:hypothetical protein